MEHIIEAILGLGGLAAYIAIGSLAFGEAAAFVGLLLPGEIAVLLGGVLASQGRVSLPIMLMVAAVSAVAGDSAGYEIGRRWGPLLLRSRIGRRHAATIRDAHEYMVRRGGLMVFVGRWTSVLRAIVPAVAGMSRMPYRRFLVFNLIGGVAWATAFTLGGYIAGESYARVEAATGWGTWIVGGLLVAWIVTRFAMRRLRTRTTNALQSEDDDETTEPAQEEVLT
jgi:membrane protein DedA with SNARE-associated domain